MGAPSDGDLMPTLTIVMDPEDADSKQKSKPGKSLANVIALRPRETTSFDISKRRKVSILSVWESLPKILGIIVKPEPS